MPPLITFTQVTGIILVLTGAAAFSLTGFQNVRVLAPALLGFLFVAIGVQARKEKLRKRLLRIGALLGFLGFLACVRGLIQIPSTPSCSR